MAKLLKRIGGVCLVAAGIAGLVLPILPGILMILSGLLLLENQTVTRWFKKYVRKEN